METWKDIPDTDYSVSDAGRVASRKFGKWRVMRSRGSACGYLVLGICRNGVITTKLVHRLVALAFLGPPPTTMHQVNHKDGDETNNRADNLEWVTPGENKSHFLYALNRARWFSDKCKAKENLTEDQVRDVRARCGAGESQRTVAADYGLARESVSRIVNRKRWANLP